MSKRNREGMALLTVLLLVAAISALAVLVLDDVRFSVRRTANAEIGAQARWHALGGEALASAIIARMNRANPDRTPIEPAWVGQSRTFPIDDGSITVTVSDGQACFNLNSVVEGYGEFLIGRETGRLQLIALSRSIGIAASRAEALADALTDWIDTDAVPEPQGAEDGAYQAGLRPYRTGGTLLAEVSELRAVRGVDPGLYSALRPWVCALPNPDLSTINVNTLTPAQAPLLVMLTQGRLNRPTAEALIASRPGDGWPDIEAFRRQPVVTALTSPSGLEQTTVRTRFFNIRVDVALAGAPVVRTALLEIDRQGAVRTVTRRWTIDE